MRIALLVLAVLIAAPAEQGPLIERLRTGPVEERRVAAERLGEIGDGGAIASLVDALRDPDPIVRSEAGSSLWAIWHRSGDPVLDERLQQGILLMEMRRLPEAVSVFSEVIARNPDFAEGWNKRATAYYLMGDLDCSLADCEEVVKRNPVHFGALSGFGLIYLQKENLDAAAQYFAKALAVNPNLAQIEALLDQIREALRLRRQQSI